MTGADSALAAGFIRKSQNPDGGWGYEPGRQSLVEPSALCALALHAGGAPEAAGRGLAFLGSCQKPSGAVGFGPADRDGGWMAYAALLAFHSLGAPDGERRLRSWILAWEDASGRFSKTDIAEIAARFRYDASIPGWGWTPRTTAWIEPTALFILALRRTGTAATEPRIKSGLALISDRRVPSGGWNFGNPYSRSFELEATALSTALALAALGAAGVREENPAAAAGLGYLAACLAGEVSTAALAWSALALKSFPGGAALARDAAARLARRQNPDGGFRGNLFETALAWLVLSGSPILLPAAEGIR